MEARYLYCQTGTPLQDPGQDPDKPDGTEYLKDEEEEGEREQQDEGFQEDAGDLMFADDLNMLLWQPQPAPAEAQMEEVQEEQDVIGPDGHGGNQHAVRLAHALVGLRLQAWVTQRQVAEVVTLWDMLSDRDKAPVSFPPHHQDRLVSGRFQAGHRKVKAIVGLDSSVRSFLGQGSGAALSPKVSMTVKAIFLELCCIHYEGRTIAGTRVNRWQAVLRDYAMIRDNVYGHQALLAAAPVQLYEVNKRTVMQWHNERSKAFTTEQLSVAVPGPSAQQTTEEQLEPARALLSQPVRPDRPLLFDLPEDASGQAATRRGALAPELHGLLTPATASADGASSSGTPRASTSTDAPTSSSSVPRTATWQRKVREEQQRLAEEGQGGAAAPGRGSGCSLQEAQTLHPL